MGGEGAMPMAWMPMCGQSWLAASLSFIGTWTLMMAAMMLPSLVPMLWRYRQSVGRAGGLPPALLTALMAGGYLTIWALLGAVVYPLGVALMAITMGHAILARAVPIGAGFVVLAAGALQFTRWKAHHLACCRDEGCRASLVCSRAVRPGAFTALRHGLRLGMHCGQCCAGLTAVLLVTGMMDVPVMAAVTAGITLERLSPAGERIARAVGVVVIGAGLFLTLHAAGLS